PLGRSARRPARAGPAPPAPAGEHLIPILQRPAPQLEAAGALFQAAESLLEQLLVPLEVAAPARRLLFEDLARLHQLLLRGEDDALTGFPQEPLGLRGRRAGCG